MTRGFLLGKFLPPHAGHIYLCQSAAALCDRLTVLVCSLPDDPISGADRFCWMADLLPNVNVVHLTDVVPQEPKDHPDFWPIWTAICRNVHPEPIDFVFGSETYVLRLAAELQAEPILIDPERLTFPVSGSAIRSDPVANWRFLPGPVRRHFQKRVVLVGAESVGKSTMASNLAAHYATPFLPEYGRTYDASKIDRTWGPEDFVMISARHRALRHTLAPSVGPALIEDTDPLLTLVWQQYLTGLPAPSRKISDLADLYLLLDADIPWHDDGTRYQSNTADRLAFQALCEEILLENHASFMRISGDHDARFARCVAAVDGLIGKIS